MMESTGVALGIKVHRIMIVDDHPTVREGLSHRINAQPDMMVCGTAADVQDALREVNNCNPNLIIIDISLKTGDGIDLVKAIAARYPKIRLLVHSMYDEGFYADRCLRAGAQGYVNKESDPNDVVRAIREILVGKIYLSEAMTAQVLGQTFRGQDSVSDAVTLLTDRQLEIFRLIGEGEGVREIAQRLKISVHTVETHRENIKRKLQIDKLIDLYRRAVLWTQENR